MTTTAPERLSYGIQEAYEALGISRATLYRLIKAGDLPCHKLRGRAVVRRDDLLALLGSPPAVAERSHVPANGAGAEARPGLHELAAAL